MDSVASTVLPVFLIDSEARLLATVSQVRRDVNLDTRFLWQAGRLRITAGDEDTAIRKELQKDA